ncbi:MAG: hypothetical protein LBG93_03050 [Treponema sp.]|nr:hypothetical protein [Treponema sp.]
MKNNVAENALESINNARRYLEYLKDSLQDAENAIEALNYDLQKKLEEANNEAN